MTNDDCNSVDAATPDTACKIEVQDISNEDGRIYHYENPNGGDDIEVLVDGSLYLSIAWDGSHQITCADRAGMILRPDFKAIAVHSKFGKPAFKDHPVMSPVVDDGEA